jgi:hypothetical protein
MKEISIDWCPTKKMVADFMTKPLQGSLFRELRDFIMGRVRCIKPKTDVVSLGQKKASKKLIKKSKVNGKHRITVTGSKECANYWQQGMRQGYVTVVLIPLCHRSVLGFILCRRYHTVDG